jgi:hypothetical protein
MEDLEFDSGQLKQGFLFTENVQRISKFLSRWRIGRGVRLKTFVWCQRLD